MGLSTSDELQEHVRGSLSAKEMCERHCNVFQRHSLLNRARGCHAIYTVEMKKSEKMLGELNRVQQLCLLLILMDVEIVGEKKEMTILNALPSIYEHIIIILDAIDIVIALFTPGLLAAVCYKNHTAKKCVPQHPTKLQYLEVLHDMVV